MKSLVPSPAGAGRPPLDVFCDRVRTFNPFLSNRVNEPSADEGVAAIHQDALLRLTELARAAHEQRRGVGVMLWGEAGIGKSHLLARLHHWAGQQKRACCVYLHNLSASPEHLPRSVLRTMVGVLTRGRQSQLHRTPLYHLGLSGLSEALGRDTAVRHKWSVAERAWRTLIDRLGASDPGRAALLDRTVYQVLLRFTRSAHRLRRGKVDGLAPLAVRWLSGDNLSPDEAARLGLPPGGPPDEPQALADNQQIKHVLVALAHLALWRGQPLILCFDQVDNLDTDQAAALARFLEALLDSAPNVLVITAGVQETLIGWREAGVIQASAWDRLAQVEVALQRIPAAVGRWLVTERLERFLQGFEDLAERWLRQDPLFPLGRRWETEFFEGRIDVRPRDVINAAAAGWRREKERLQELGKSEWFATWGERQRQPPPAPKLVPRDEAVDGLIADRLAAHRATRRESDLPPSAGDLAALVYRVVEQWRKVDPDTGIVAVDVAMPSSKRPTYDAILRQRTADGAEIRVGLLFLGPEPGRMTNSLFGRLVADEKPPDRLFVISDGRKALPLGPAGKQKRQSLQERGPQRYRELALSFEEHVELEGLLTVARQARAGELELGTPPPVSEQEAVASLQRQGRYRAAPVLRELVPS
jgi:AAA ATPase domain